MSERRETGSKVGATSDALPLTDETMTLAKRSVVTGKIRVSTRTQTREEWAEVALEHTVADVARVPIERIVEAIPDVRTEGEITIVPVVEERMVVVKQLYLKEELHIRRRVEIALSRTSVDLRRQTGVVEHLDADGQVVGDDESAPQS